MPSPAPAETFRALHDRPDRSEPLVLPNVWDAVSARAFAAAGFPALATSSSAVAAVLGHEDGGHTPAEEMFAAVTRIIRSVDVPVTVDIESGYGLPAAEVAERLLAAGAAGCNLEDTDHSAKKLRDAREQAAFLADFTAAAGGRLVLNARIDTFLHGDRDAAAAVERARLYAEAGAEVVYPILAPAGLLSEIAGAVAVPLNALYLPGGPAPAELGRLGAARVTFGGGLHDRATAALTDIARSVAQP
ncbi:isocitrate lyase/phosphoenolpyruvate mutase family protein [Streptomyces sp. AM 2-1-1]|uniref:isocitrate lyase/PEP mutase family protein n=1 Tax=unclassified Streptomyces TaxID=2593676 RepID=UPI0023B93BCA|nr:isocitrate lyase/phosphoenolpyruvate mutase family protein [Streptomyces sp. AM 2-1-1]WEH39166.1 isocitrate lyase/phosphoenolpyruvate mutase family protein [Streptomyces sp. AM 2-1-1]